MIESDRVEEIGLRREIAVASAAARSGLSLAREMAGGGATIKQGRDVVTRADVAVEELITNALSTVFPYPVIGEEEAAIVRSTAHIGSSTRSVGHGTTHPAFRCTASTSRSSPATR